MRSKEIISNATFILALAIFVSGEAIAQSGTWTTKAPMPTARYGAGAGVIGGKLYVAGGCCMSNVFPTPRFHNLEAYDPATDVWTTKTPIPLAVYAAAAGVINDKLYIAGGSASQTEGNTVATLQVYDPVYDPTSDGWTTGAVMPVPVLAAAAGVINGKLYVAGGHDGTFTNALRVYDPASDMWTTKNPMSTARAGQGGGVINGILYAVGGINDSGSLATLEAYDPNSNTWTTKAPMPTARYWVSVEVVNNILYVVGGYNGSMLDTVEAYDPITNNWTTQASMLTARQSVASGSLNNALYAVGGINDSGNLATNEAFTLDTTPPTTVASASPAANAAGWNNVNVTVALSATDNTGGSGVQSIIYALTGAQTGGGSVTGSATSTLITAEGTTTVTYHARDVAGNVESDKTLVIRLDKTAPALTVPASMTVNATSPSGAVATFAPTATDATSGVASLISSPASGSMFPPGTTTVTVTATDTAGNSSTASFTVTVLSPAQAMSNVLAAVTSLGFQQGSSLLKNALSQLGSGNTTAACNQMGAFINQVQAQAGKQLTTAQATQLIQAATQIRGALGCS